MLISRFYAFVILFVDFVSMVLDFFPNHLTVRRRYSRSELLSYSHVPGRLDIAKWRTLCQLGLVSPQFKPTKRSCRAGAFKQRQIETVTSYRPDSQPPAKSPSSVTHENLHYIETDTVQQPSSQCVKFSLFNSRSVKTPGKSVAIVDYVVENDVDILALTETWLTGDSTVAAGEVTPEGYKLHHVPRSRRRGGGVGVLYKSGFSIRIDDSHPKTKTFESTSILIQNGSCSVRLVVVYRPERSKKNPYSFTDFIAEFTDIVDGIYLDKQNLLLVGDFNVHVDDARDREAVAFLDCLSACNLTQHVTKPTHRHGHTLDLIITRSNDDTVVGDAQIDDLAISDHFAVLCDLRLQKPPALRKHISWRKFKEIDIAQVCHDLRTSTELLAPTSDAATIVSHYNNTLSTILDKYAPVKERTVTIRPDTAWYTDDIRDLKRERKALERRWRKTGLEVHRQAYCAKRQQVNAMLQAAKEDHYSRMVSDNSQNSKALFKVIDKLMHRDRQTPLPSCDSHEQLATDFSEFFTDKIQTIRVSLGNDTDTPVETDDTATPPAECNLSDLRPATEDEVRKLLMTSPSKSCELDPFPTWLLKLCAEPAVPILTQLINASIAEGYVDTTLKTAHVRPLLKNPSLDINNLKHYRPVSNLPFVSKLLERVVAARLSEHMDKHGLHEPFQSAYKPNHSVESALIRVQSDILQAMDKQHVVVLVMLDLSAAFDTIDHQVLLHRLSHDLGITGTALHWFQSYLEDRTQSVTIKGTRSPPQTLRFGVPQGSVLGPQVFSVYAAPIGRIIKKHGLERHFYADDTQVYFSFNPSEVDIDDIVRRIVGCIKEIQQWMVKNFLKLNDDKTDIMLFGSSHQLKKVSLVSVPIGEAAIVPSSKVRNLGVVQDSTMSMTAHVSHVCSSAYMHLRNISRIRPFLSQRTTEQLVHAFVSSRLDMGNALLFGITQIQLGRLQRIQNSAARLVTRTRRCDHITPVLRELHWLPVKHRIEFKILLQVYRAVNNSAPVYISELLQKHAPSRALRSGNNGLLVVPRTRTLWGDRSFQAAGPRLWNALPASIRQSDTLTAFKTALKTHIFVTAFL